MAIATQNDQTDRIPKLYGTLIFKMVHGTSNQSSTGSVGSGDFKDSTRNDIDGTRQCGNDRRCRILMPQLLWKGSRWLAVNEFDGS